MITGEPVRGGFPDPAFFNLPGIDQARAWLRGEVPATPLAHLMGIRLTQVGPGAVTATVPASPWLQMADRSIDFKVIGGMVVELCALSGLGPAMEVWPATFSLTHLRPCLLEHAPLVLRSRVVHAGPNFTLVELLVEDTLGRAVAQVQAHVLVRPMVPVPPPRSYEMVAVTPPTYPSPDPPLRPLPLNVGVIFAQVLEEHDGLTISQKVLSGELSVPAYELVGIRAIEAQAGSCALALPATEWHCNWNRYVNSGVILRLADAGLSLAAFTLSRRGQQLGIVNQALTIFRPVPPDGRDLMCRAKVVHENDELIASTCELTDPNGNRVALGHQTSLLSAPRRGKGSPKPERVLATVLFTDIVGSTERAEALGDAKWGEALAEHHALVRRQLGTYRGREVKTTGDGFLAAFDSPARAVQCARAIRDGVRHLGLEIRAGLHSGECEVVGSDLAGIAVHVASRVESAAGPGQILISSTVRDLVAGSGLRFADHGRHRLKGLEGEWHLLAVED